MIARLFALLMLLAATPTRAQIVPAPVPVTPTADATSPDGRIRVHLETDGDGRPLWSLGRDGKPVITPSRLGFILADKPKMERHFQIAAQSRRSFDQTWEQPWGERRYVRDRHNELRVRLTETKGEKRSLDVVFRLFDTGIGFRYEFPDQPSLKTVRIAEELTEFHIAERGTAWWPTAFEWNREEYLYNKTPLAEVGVSQTPMTMRLTSGLHLSIHEAALVDYSAMNVAHVERENFKAALTPANNGPKVVREAPFPTPWRTILIADSAPGLYNASDLTLNLNEPNKLGDVSWVKPCKYVAIWWGMFVGKYTWASGPKHGATTPNALHMIDYAQRNGFCGLLIEGWNVGWDADWFGDGKDFSFTKAYPDFDLPRIAAYARAHHVRLIGHNETSGNAAHYEDEMGAGFDLYQRLGIDMVKTGYVADAGGIRARLPDGTIGYEWHEGQVAVRHHLKVVTEAAKRHVSIDAHEPVKDTGLRRTYPNWVAREGQRGQEYNAFGSPKNPPEHETNLFYGRMLGGPMDFTPGVVSTKGDRGEQIPATIAKELAQYIVLYSPIQMAADLEENYAKYPQAFQFIKDVAVDWEQSRALMGELGEYAVIARKDRRSPNWYLGATGGVNARQISVPLDFLPPRKRYSAQIYRDGPNADWKTAPQDMVIETRTVTSADRLDFRLASGGGAAVRFVPAKGR